MRTRQTNYRGGECFLRFVFLFLLKGVYVDAKYMVQNVELNGGITSVWEFGGERVICYTTAITEELARQWQGMTVEVIYYAANVPVYGVIVDDEVLCAMFEGEEADEYVRKCMARRLYTVEEDLEGAEDFLIFDCLQELEDERLALLEALDI